MADYLYVCQFSNGHIKVGRSVDPKSRIATHVDRVACMGIELREHFVTECDANSMRRESQLIAQCVEAASDRFKSEWFAGLEFRQVREWAEYWAACEMPPATDMPSLEDRKRLAAIACVSPGVLLQALNGEKPASPIAAVRIERLTDGELRRWHLRAADWHLIWPELIGAEGAPRLGKQPRQAA